jgi:integrase
VASVFKAKGAKHYTINYVDETGRRRKKKGATDKGVTKRIANEIENRVALLRDGVVDPKAAALAKQGARPLGEHFADWLADMQARGNTPAHAKLSYDRARKTAALTRGVKMDLIDPGRKPAVLALANAVVAAMLKSAKLDDLTPERIQSALATLKAAGKSSQTINHYRAALRAFCLWMVGTGRMRDNPMRGVRGLNVEKDRRHTRRNLTGDEFGRLLVATVLGPTREGMPADVRAWAYRLAAWTGFRVNELRTLTPESFQLDGDRPTVSVSAEHTKNGKAAVQPIPPGFAESLISLVAWKPPGVPLLPLAHETARAMRADLKSAGVAYKTPSGVADFHSLRSYYVSALIRGGATIKEVQTMARHANPATTLKHYATVTDAEKQVAIDRLWTPSPANQDATDSATRPVQEGVKPPDSPGNT